MDKRKNIPEIAFSKVPEGRKELAELIKKDNGWSGFQTPYSEVLRPAFLDYYGESKADLVLVDIGCGWGEHDTLAALGYPGMDVPEVKKVVGIGIDKQEIKIARLLSTFAKREPWFFRQIMQTTDIGIKLGGRSSPTVENFKNVLKNPNLIVEFEELIKEGSDDELSVFISQHILKNSSARTGASAVDPNLQNQAEFIQGDIYNPPLPDNFADRIISSSVAGYIQDPQNEEAMWKNMLRIIKPKGVINVISFEYERDGALTSGPVQLAKIAKELNVDLAVVQNRDSYQEKPKPNWRRQTIYEVIKKP